MRMGIVTDRRRKQRLRLLRGRLMGLLLLAIAGLSAASLVRGGAGKAMAALAGSVSDAVSAVRAGSMLTREKPVAIELTLPERRICALQLGVFDDGERASLEAQRLQAAGVRCVIWQGERMRIVSCAALSREALDMESAGGQEAYVLQETLPAVAMKIEAGERSAAEAQKLLLLPDSVFLRLAQREEAELGQILLETRQAADQAIDAHPENALYTSLAHSLDAWCDLMDDAVKALPPQRARVYAALTMCTICRELRAALIGQGA